MRVYLVRHADAVPDSHERSDPCRWLDRAGRARAARLGAAFAQRGVRCDAILTSPYLRAAQTAELVAAGIGYTDEIVGVDWLVPDGYPSRAAQAVASAGTSVAVVAHEPLLSALCAALCGLPPIPGFHKGEALFIENGTLMWRLAT